jgi:hypothetical protein
VISRRQWAGKRGWACQNRRKHGKKAARENEKRVGRLKKARTHSGRVPEREDPKVEVKKEMKGNENHD